jgi:enoyl-CoA hydratase/carnithine racemase
MVNTVGNGRSEKALQLGLAFTPEEALAINLVDAVVAPDELISNAEEQIKLWLKIPSIYKRISFFNTCVIVFDTLSLI